MGDSRAKLEGGLARVKDALATIEEAGEVVEEANKAESEAARLEVDRTSLMLELGATKEEVSSFYSQAGKDKDAMEEEYHKAMEVIFSYGYRCCVFKHNICGDRPEVPKGMHDSSDSMLLEVFVNPKCPPVQVVVKATMIEVPLNKAAKEPVEIDATEDQDRLWSLFLHSYLITTFCKGTLADRIHLCTLWAPLVL